MVYVLLTINSLLMVIMPILLGVWLVRRYKVGWSLFFIGALGFIVSQIGHIPFNQLVLNPIISGILEGGEAAGSNLLVALLLGLSAGVFEEVTRYIFYRLRKNMRSWDQGLMFGTGWGGAEAIIFGLLAATSIVNIYLYQSGLIYSLVPAELGGDTAEAIAAGAQEIENLVNAPPWTFLLGAVERVFALTLHLSLSILVLQVFLRKNLAWLFIAIGWHTLVNAVAVFGSLQGWNVLLIEGAIGLSAIASFGIIHYFKPRVASSEGEAANHPTDEAGPDGGEGNSIGNA